jgi:hypothetical protein
MLLDKIYPQIPTPRYSEPLSNTLNDLEAGPRVGIRGNGTAGLDRDDNLGGRGSQVPVFRQSESRVDLLVDDTDHAVPAVSALRAIVPDGSIVFDDDLEDIGSEILVGNEVEAGEE